MSISIEANKIAENPETSRSFLLVLENRVFETGKRRANFGYLFVVLGIFFFLCHYFEIKNISFLGAEFPVNLGHLYWGATVTLSVLYLYIMFLLAHEVNILGVLEAGYRGLKLPKTLFTTNIILFVLFPSPLSYMYLSAHRGASIFNIGSVHIVVWLLEVLTALIIGLLHFLAPVLAIVYFASKGVQRIGVIEMWFPIVVALMSMMLVMRTLIYSGVGWIHVE